MDHIVLYFTIHIVYCIILLYPSDRNNSKPNKHDQQRLSPSNTLTKVPRYRRKKMPNLQETRVLAPLSEVTLGYHRVFNRKLRARGE